MTLSAMSSSHPQPGGTLNPGSSVTTDCLLITAIRNLNPQLRSADLVTARAQIMVRYKTLLFPREYQSGHFCWVSTPPSGHQWQVCDALDVYPPHDR